MTTITKGAPRFGDGNQHRPPSSELTGSSLSSTQRIVDLAIGPPDHAPDERLKHVQMISNWCTEYNTSRRIFLILMLDRLVRRSQGGLVVPGSFRPHDTTRIPAAARHRRPEGIGTSVTLAFPVSGHSPTT